MQKFDVQITLEKIRDARHEWGVANSEFNAAIDKAMTRLLHEAAANYMSVTEVAAHSGLTKARVNRMMKNAGLNPYDGKTLLHDRAAKALAENAELMGIDPHEMDLMSPLAYLPMGSQMKEALQSEAVKGVKEVAKPDLGELIRKMRDRGSVVVEVEEDEWWDIRFDLDSNDRVSISLDDLDRLIKASA